MAVLTGGPGTGKTTTTRSIIRLVEAAGKRALLASPTGRAAKRLSEATGRPAKTVHRLLEFKPGEGFSFQRNEENPLEADIVILDEASMLDLLLTNHMLKAVPPGAHLLLVGDIDQLPSVGAGNVLRDVIEAIEGQGNRTGPGFLVRPWCAWRRSSASRKAAISSPMPTASTRDRCLPSTTASRRTFSSFEKKTQSAAELIVDLVRERIPRKFGLKPEEIQVLSPMHRGDVGVGTFNLKLQAALNPMQPSVNERPVGGRIFREGDRVMQIRNNYDKEVYNGDMGRINSINLEDQVVTVRIDDRPIGYDFLELDELIHAYAISIHKAQGSEFPAVVIPLLTTHYVMLQRNLLYTAVTRARTPGGAGGHASRYRHRSDGKPRPGTLFRAGRTVATVFGQYRRPGPFSGLMCQSPLCAIISMEEGLRNDAVPSENADLGKYGGRHGSHYPVAPDGQQRR